MPGLKLQMVRKTQVTSKTLRKFSEAIIGSGIEVKSLDECAKYVAMSRRTFTRKFQQETGLSFMLWLQRAKVYLAIAQLADGKSVQDTAFDLGYENVSAFISMFKKHTGKSPLKFISQ